MTSHGRATPLVWKSVQKATLEGKRNSYETEVIDRLGAALPGDVKVTSSPTVASALDRVTLEASDAD